MVAASLSISAPAHADDLVGKARALGGDTLDVGGRYVRLYGVDASDGGRDASFALAFETAEHWLRCQPRGPGVAPLVAVCFIGPYDLGEIMVRKGWARAVDAAYVGAETEARSKRVGIWSGLTRSPLSP